MLLKSSHLLGLPLGLATFRSRSSHHWWSRPEKVVSAIFGGQNLCAAN
jgi:hypothetical protein